MKPIKLVVFDLDGTLFDDTIFIWQSLHDAFNTDKEKRKKGIDLVHEGKMSYKDWVKHDVELFNEVGAKKKDFLKVIGMMKLMTGARETLSELKKKGYRLAIISGSLNLALEHLLPEHADFFDDVLINHFFFDRSGAISSWDATPYDGPGKALGLKHLCKKYGITPEQCVFIGDHSNDVEIAELAGKSIAFNCKSDRLAQIADVVIMDKDLRMILEHIS